MRTTNKEDNISKTSTKTKSKDRITTLIKPMKPVYIGDLRLIRSYVKKPKAALKKQKYPVKARICAHCGLLTKSLNSHMLQHIGRCTFYYTSVNFCFHTSCLEISSIKVGSHLFARLSICVHSKRVLYM